MNSEILDIIKKIYSEIFVRGGNMQAYVRIFVNICKVCSQKIN